MGEDVGDTLNTIFESSRPVALRIRIPSFSTKQLYGHIPGTGVWSSWKVKRYSLPYSLFPKNFDADRLWLLCQKLLEQQSTTQINVLYHNFASHYCNSDQELTSVLSRHGPEEIWRLLHVSLCCGRNHKSRQSRFYTRSIAEVGKSYKQLLETSSVKAKLSFEGIGVSRNALRGR